MSLRAGTGGREFGGLSAPRAALRLPLACGFPPRQGSSAGGGGRSRPWTTVLQPWGLGKDACCELHCVPLQDMLKSSPLVPQKVIFLGNRVIAVKMESCRIKVGPKSNVWSPYKKRGDRETHKNKAA